jgi:autotransporter family porin
MFKVKKIHLALLSGLSVCMQGNAEDVYIDANSDGIPYTTTESYIDGNLIVAAGTVLPTGESVYNEASISGSLINYGSAGGSAFVNGQFNGGASGLIQGDMLNATSGTAYSFVNSKSSDIQGNIRNDGILISNVQNLGLIHGALINAGTVGYLSDTGLVVYNSGDILGDLNNSGTINGDLLNSGIILGEIINSGTINGNISNTGATTGIINSGTVTGTVALGNTSLTLIGSTASIVGVVSGSDTSAIKIGNVENAASYTANMGNDVTIGTIAVANGSSLTLANGVIWKASSSASDAIDNSGYLILSNGSILTGNLTNAGTLSLSNESSTLSTINGNVTNSGAVILNPTSTSAGNTLHISGNYTGITGSTITFGTVLGDDSSLTDRLTIAGSTSGTSKVILANENGTGALTLEGIRLIEVDGDSSGIFTQGNRIVAGAYDYSLIKGIDGWYLTSTYLNPTPTPTPTPANGTQVVRPEAASYAANLQAANTIFAMNLNDREGPYSRESGGLWLRQAGGRKKIAMDDGQNKTSANYYVVQLGSSLWQFSTGDIGLLSTGVMAGYAMQRSQTTNSLTAYQAKGSVNGYSTGVYATWYKDAQEKSGLYMDSWLQYAWFDNEVKGDDLTPENYNSRGLMASVETGYNWKINKWATSSGMVNSLWLKPHAQVIWSDIKADNFIENNGTQVKSSGENNVQLRTGLRAYLNGKSALDKDTGREFQPFVEANWIYNTVQYGTGLNGVQQSQKGTRNAGELKVGVEARVTTEATLWAGVSKVMGGSGYADTQGYAGIRYNF